MALSKNQKVVLSIEGLGANGEGIARLDGFSIFVPFALIGEKVKAIIIMAKKNYAVAKVIEVITPAEERIRPVCPVFGKCGGCQTQHLKYQNQLRHKSNIVKEALAKYAKLRPEVLTCVKSELCYGYRNKLAMPVSSEKGKLEFGFFADNSHRIVPFTGCNLHSDWTIKLVEMVKEFAEQNNISGYNEQTQKGILRHVIIKEFNDQYMLILVINADTLDVSPLIEEISKTFSSFSLYLNINKEKTNVVTGSKYIHIAGQEVLRDATQGIRYEVNPASFMQINTNVRDKIYQKASELIKDNGEDYVCIDAYSGAGLLTAILSKSCSKIYAIEIVPEAVESAKYLKETNNLSDNIVHILGDCAVEVPKLMSKLEGQKTALILDPPRKGCDKSVIKSILSVKPDLIIYISCNPATLARDLGYIIGTIDPDEENAYAKYEPNELYEISFVQPFDMFPQTKHVETLVCLKKVSN